MDSGCHIFAVFLLLTVRAFFPPSHFLFVPSRDFITLSRTIVKTQVHEHTKLFGQRMHFRLDNPPTASGPTAPSTYKVEEENSNSNLWSQQVAPDGGVAGTISTESDKSARTTISDSINRTVDFSSRPTTKTDPTLDGLDSHQSASSTSKEASVMDTSPAPLKIETSSSEASAMEVVRTPACLKTSTEQAATSHERIAVEAASASFGLTMTAKACGRSTSESSPNRASSSFVFKSNVKEQEVFYDAASEEQANTSHDMLPQATVVSPINHRVHAKKTTANNGMRKPVAKYAVGGGAASNVRDVAVKRQIPLENQLPNKHHRSTSAAFGVSGQPTRVPVKKEEASDKKASADDPISTQAIALQNEAKDADDDSAGKAASNAAPTLALGRVEKDICRTLAELEDLNIKHVSKFLLANLVGYTCTNSRGFSTACSSLARSGCTSRDGSLTQLGRSAVPQCDLAPPTNNEEMHDKIRDILRRLSSINPKKRMPKIDEIFGALADGKAHRCIDVANAGGYAGLNSKGYSTMVAVMKELGLINKPGQGLIQLADICFPFGKN